MGRKVSDIFNKWATGGNAKTTPAKAKCHLQDFFPVLRISEESSEFEVENKQPEADSNSSDSASWNDGKITRALEHSQDIL